MGQLSDDDTRRLSLGYIGLPMFPRALFLLAALAFPSAAATFGTVVTHGIPGRLMPGSGQLSGAEISALYDYVRSLNAAR